MRATSSCPSQSRSATAGVKSEKPPVHLGKPATGWPVRPSQACSAAESVARITSGTPSPETSDSAGALMKARPWIGCESYLPERAKASTSKVAGLNLSRPSNEELGLDLIPATVAGL